LKRFRRVIDLIGTTLPQLAALIANAQLVLTNNTSTMHLADATRTECCYVCRHEYESQWRPRHSPSRLRRPTLCVALATPTCPYQLECLDIPPEEVVAGPELQKEKSKVNRKFPFCISSFNFLA